MSIKLRVPLFPFLHIELRGGSCDIVRVELHSPRVEVPIVLLWLRPRPSVRWATTDEIVSCVSDALDAYRLTQDGPGTIVMCTRCAGPFVGESTDTVCAGCLDVPEEDDCSDTNAEVADLDRLDTERAIHTILGAESGWNIGNRLCVARVRAGMSRAQAANLLRWPGITSATLLAIEENTHSPTPDALGKLANLYDVSVEWLRGESAPSPLRAAVAESGLSWADKAKLGDMLDSMAPASEPSAAIPLLHTLWGRAAAMGYPRRPKRWWIEVQRAQEQGHDISDVLREAARDLDAHEQACEEDAADEPGPAMAPAAPSSDPLPCPFCGDHDPSRSRYGDGDEFALIECGTCGGRYDGRWADGWAEWNRRAPALSDDDRERLDEIRERIDYMAEQGQGREYHVICRLPFAMVVDLMRMAERGSVPADVAPVRRAGALTAEPDPDGWRDVATITPEEWAAWRWWMWRTEPPRWRSGREDIPSFGKVRRVPVLAWPEMSGDCNIPGRDITGQMLAAWPVWVVDCGHGERIIRVTDMDQGDAQYLGCEWRPLRLPGMSTDLATIGEIAGGDMTREHFERVDEWTVRHDATRPWSTPWSYKERGMPAIIRPYKHWRPAAFGQD